ncbi:sodium-independent sulfate anion transporter isoform X2 [Agrilus planipennis]|uniref:Sodium-independent sulfate anion transporter isoform X2 n=1 Tax=Agrilus planipennis TaxID=224129 RepID=A0A7F5RC69_AGRPL|nr:sodium-independent sulfate anion transporter isoform X2 [Agrilus planipennis]
MVKLCNKNLSCDVNLKVRLKRHVPIIDWLPSYTVNKLFHDLLAGLTVALTEVPQSLAYAAIAGFVVEFFSYPVIAGFTSAAAIQTGSAQLRSLLGISGQGSEFLDSWITVIENIRKVRIGDTILGICTVVFLLVVKYVCSSGSSKSDPQKTKTQNVMSLFFWLFSLTRYALAVIFGAVLAFTLSQYDRMPFVLTGNVERGLPGFSVPNFGTTYNNETFSFIQMISNYDSSIVFIPMISILEHISIAKAFAQGKTIDGTQEMLALGMCNIASSFVRSMPITGSFTRTAVNNQSGVKTTFAGFFTGCLVLMSLGFITSFFYYIPKATLAAVVISAMVNLVEFKAVPILWRSKKTDVIPFLVTLLTSLLWNLEYGIIVGIVVNIFFILYKSARPSIKIETKLVGDINVYLVEPTTNLQFPSAEFLKESVLAQCDASISFIIIDGKNMESIDATVAKNLKALIDNLKIRKQTIIFWNFREKVVKVCINLDKSMDGYFFQGSLSNVIEEFQGANPNQKRGNDLDQA